MKKKGDYIEVAGKFEEIVENWSSYYKERGTLTGSIFERNDDGKLVWGEFTFWTSPSGGKAHIWHDGSAEMSGPQQNKDYLR